MDENVDNVSGGANEGRRIAWPTAMRLAEYLIILEELASEGAAVVSSRQLAALFGNNASQVRQDLASLGRTGRVGQGYSVADLQNTIRGNLGLQLRQSVAIVGCGRLGLTLALHVPFAKYGMDLAAAFDVAPAIVGTRVGSLVVAHASRIPEVCRDRQITLAALTVPKSSAQEEADLLVAGGVKGILNYTRVRLKVPRDVVVQNRQIICSFMLLSHAAFMRQAAVDDAT